METELIEELTNNYLVYEKETGFFFWKKIHGKIKAGSLAGGVVKGESNKYRVITFRKSRFYAHVLVWYIFNGLPKSRIIHIDGDGLNNKIENLKIFVKMTKEEKAKRDCKNALAYYYKNKEKIVIYNRKWKRKQKEENTDWYIKSKIRTRVKAFLKSKGYKKRNKTEQLLGCSANEAVLYLKKLGYDHEIQDIDHIIPLCLFDLNNEEHIKIMFHYSNLQPLCRIKNRKTKRANLDIGWEKSLKNTCSLVNADYSAAKSYFSERLHGKEY